MSTVSAAKLRHTCHQRRIRWRKLYPIPSDVVLKSGAAVAATIKAVLPLGPVVMYEASTEGGVALKISQTRDAGLQPMVSGGFARRAGL